MLDVIDADFTPVAAPSKWKVDPFQGGNNGEVSRQWASRPADQKFLSLSALRDRVRQRADVSSHRVVGSKALEFVAPEISSLEDTHKLAIGLPGGDLVGPTHWSFNQLASLGDFSVRELRKLPSPIVADVLSWQYRQRQVEDVKLLMAEGGLRAVTGPNYGWISDADVIEAVQQIAGDGLGDMRWKVPGVLDWATHTYDPHAPVTLNSTTLFASDRDVFVFLVDDLHPIEIGKLKDGSPDYVFRGFYITNSEVGAGSLRLATFYLRAVCGNRCLWGVEHFDELCIRHTSSAPSRFIEEARPALLSYGNGDSSALVEGVQKAKEAVVAREESEALDWLKKQGFSQKRAKLIATLDAESGAEREEGDFPRTAWDFSQSITAFARTIPNTDDRLEVEKVAGKLLDKVAR